MCRACARSQQLRLQLDRGVPTVSTKGSRSGSIASDCSSVVPSTKASPTDSSTAPSTPCSVEAPPMKVSVGSSPTTTIPSTTRPLCAYFKNDRCRMGNACRFAHSLKEHKNPRLILMRRFPQCQQSVGQSPYVAQPTVVPNPCYAYVAPPVQQPYEGPAFPVASPNGPMAVPPPPQMYYYYQPAAQAAPPMYYAPVMVQKSPGGPSVAPVVENH
ncbi:hypothetical protein Pmar_PMAR019206 [Perkinsus marinus ATCC 50983]|uniref:C3H1-type domain-containing protein n=1 Tax=Perkinsus marinus (strain ATCC 50983 / TXsc) TaxID=423536 RepID=C5KU58_PERM5|nr:hypothetical protein Pmar_PMAR019206 [Perkinsus marinus ATCC 50983]EER12100.1 hypothetical protein Pmar_PMAR019206 [Perkinsus marinus ATCC 50983]|eukprot:XP_002780305.1 hypothetical protein Pmar_PMAR019206 [Perkinsus marinus ATCC 50983]